MPTKPKAPRPPQYSYMLRLLGRSPTKVPLRRLGEYLTEFANLLGEENEPRLVKIKNASVGLLAKVAEHRMHHTHLRLVTARTEPSSRPGKCLSNLQQMIDTDEIAEAQLQDQGGNVLYLFTGRKMEAAITPTLYQSGSVDGVVTGLVGADDTMHLHLRDYLDRDIRILVRDEHLARTLLSQFRRGTVRVQVQGQWKRTEQGWIPETSRCTASSFEVLDDTPLSEVLSQFAAVPGNGWATMKNPMAFWTDLRGAE